MALFKRKTESAYWSADVPVGQNKQIDADEDVGAPENISAPKNQ